jgi:outer membrane protein assembly factor BamB
MRFCHTILVLIYCLFCFVPTSTAVMLSDWPEFRGPMGNGISDNSKPPVEWGPIKNVVWKRSIPGSGWSSPVVYDGLVFLTTAITDTNNMLKSLRVFCINADTGDVVWNKEAFPWSGKPKKHTKNSYASPTPIVANERIYAHFGPMGTVCFSMSGELIWKQEKLAYSTPHGNGGSPVLYQNKLIFSNDDSNFPYIVALDAQSGDVIWRTDRATEAANKFSFSTPIIIEENGQKVVISVGSGMVGAYDINNGKEIWHVRYGNGFSVVPRPIFAHGLIFVTTGFSKPGCVLAIKTGGIGDVTDTHIVWNTEENTTPHTPSMLVVGEDLYFITDSGLFSCVNVHTGQLNWEEKIRGKFSASLTYADGRIYAISEAGTTVVVQASKKFKILAENALKESTFASPAICDSALFMRTDVALYRIEARN